MYNVFVLYYYIRMGIESGYTDIGEFMSAVGVKHRDFLAVGYTTGSGDVFQTKAVREEEERARIEGELVALAAESLATLGYDAVMKALNDETRGYYGAGTRHERLLSKVLRYVTEKKLMSPAAAAKPQPADEVESGHIANSHDAVAAVLAEEPKGNFDAFIEINKPMTPQEAIQKLATFHRASTGAVLNAFFHLRNLREATTVMFTRSVNQSEHTISMEGRKADGTPVWYSHIDRFTGQPMQHAS